MHNVNGKCSEPRPRRNESLAEVAWSRRTKKRRTRQLTDCVLSTVGLRLRRSVGTDTRSARNTTQLAGYPSRSTKALRTARTNQWIWTKHSLSRPTAPT